MTNQEKLVKVAEALALKAVKDLADADVKALILKEFVDKEKIKPLTVDERLSRIERLLKII